MKKGFGILVLLCSLILCACNETSIGIIGGADGPTNIYVSKNGEEVKGRFGVQLEKKPVRMFNIDGDLYYDSGVISNEVPRCGTLDGELKKAAGENKIPKKSGEANFSIEGYQNATSITKEVNIDGNWVIFKKYDIDKSALDGLEYCHFIKGHLNNAAVDSEIIVLSEYEDITFNDVYEPYLSSQFTPGEDKGKIHHKAIKTDEWGITLYADNVTSKGMILKIEQFGGNPTGELQTGAKYSLEVTVGDEWQSVGNKSGKDLVWVMLGYQIKKNDITEMNIGWENVYGTLPKGFYRLKKDIDDFRKAGDYDTKTYEVYFSIE